jgi:hypothetical protein
MRKELVFEAIDKLTNRNGYVPSVREIADYANLSLGQSESSDRTIIIAA